MLAMCVKEHSLWRCQNARQAIQVGICQSRAPGGLGIASEMVRLTSGDSYGGTLRFPGIAADIFTATDRLHRQATGSFTSRKSNLRKSRSCVYSLRTP